MPKGEYRQCKECGRSKEELGERLSRTGLCTSCAGRRLRANIDAIHYHNGDGFLLWRRSVAASVGGLLLDDLEALASALGDVRLSELPRVLDGLAPAQ